MTETALKIFKQTGEKIACLTAYDASFAQCLEAVGIDVVLVGDSLGMVVFGAKNTRTVGMDDMCRHTAIVARFCRRALVVSDMPYQSYETPQQALKNARKLCTAGAQIVKIEGAHPQIVTALRDGKISVWGHLGLLPQSIENPSEYRVRGRDKKSAEEMKKDAKILEAAGISALVLECIPARLAKEITENLTIPTIGIGAGKYCDGQVLVGYDMLGISENPTPRFVKNFLRENDDIPSAVAAFIRAVKNGEFPDDKHSY